MKGHQPLIAMRLRGVVPAMVWIDTEPDLLRSWRDWPRETPAHAHLEIEATDPLTRLDLRCITGLPVYVWGERPEVVEAVRVACIEFGASRVMTSVTETVGERLPRSETVLMTDTEGQLTWQR